MGPRSIAPSDPDRELTMDVVTVLAGLRLEGVVLEDFEFDLLIGAECLQHGIKTLPRPAEQLAQPRDGDTVVVVAEAVVSGLKLPPERVGLEESRALLLLIEPGAQGLTYGGVARGGHASMGSTPVQRAIEALEDVVGEANTDHP
jgi:hypothetical protein